MSKENIISSIRKHALSISIIVVLLVMVGVFFGEKQDYKFTLLNQYQVVPDVELINTLMETQGGLSGEVRGFVKFDNSADQPKDLRQYYIIKRLVDGSLRQNFSLEEIIKMQYLSPRSLGLSELVEVSDTGGTISLEDENGNKFFIDKSTKKISMKDAAGDNTTLITSDNDYRDFIKEWLRE
jgi:hypothetical protein